MDSGDGEESSATRRPSRGLGLEQCRRELERSSRGSQRVKDSERSRRDSSVARAEKATKGGEKKRNLNVNLF